MFFEQLETAIEEAYKEYVNPWSLLQYFESKKLVKDDQYYDDYIDLKNELKHKKFKTKEEFTKKIIRDIINQHVKRGSNYGTNLQYPI